MSEIKRITAEDIVRVRTQQIEDPLDYAETVARLTNPLGGPTAFAEESARRRKNEPWRDFVNNFDGRITAICCSIAREDTQIAKQQLANYFSDRIKHAKSGTYEGKSWWTADGLAISLATELFPKEEKLLRLVVKFYDAQRKAEEKYDKRKKKRLGIGEDLE